MKILILGGYGVFGGRLAELISDLAEVEIVIAGRNLSRAVEFCEAFQGSATVTPLKLDRAEIDQGLGDLRPDLVVDASGPFQDYGEDCYSVIRSCIQLGVNYLDFADAADFVFGVSQFDEDAKGAGVFVLSGVSSFPVLTAAVLRHMSKNMDIVEVEGGIAPSPYAGVGMKVIRAVVGYAGEPIKLIREGGQTTAPGLTESKRYTVAVPGRMPLRNIHFSLVDVPDLQVIPPEHKMLRSLWMGAGPGPEVLHRALNLLAKGRFFFGFPSLVPLAGVVHRVLNLLRFGEHRGGMFVHAKGLQDGRPTEQSWHLLAEGDDGPYIPSMAIEALIRKCLAPDCPEPGARAATNALELADYDPLFARRKIYSGFRNAANAADPLFRQLLGDAYQTLPKPLQALHDVKGTESWQGRAHVSRGKGLLVRLICLMIGFPEEAPDTPVTVTLTPEDGGERWTRSFGGRVFNSFLKQGEGKNGYLAVERFGVIEVALALVIDEGRLFLVPRRWTALGVPLPKFLLPTGSTFETETDSKFEFNVEISAPIVGLIVSYKGTLEKA